jgi:hypothetical protein
VNDLAYLRREVENVEMDFPQDKVWEAIAKAIKELEWTVEERDEATHKLKIKTKSNFMAYASQVTVDVSSMKENVSRVKVTAETPVTTLTGIVDFGRTRERIDTFLMTMMAQLSGKAEESQEPEQ